MRATIISLLTAAALAACGRPVEADAAGVKAPAAKAADPPGSAAPAAAAPSNPATATAPVSSDERAAAIYAAGRTPEADGKVLNDCGEAVTPDLYSVELGGDVGRALLFVMKGGPTTLTCYGMTGMEFTLLKSKGRVMKPILSAAGHFAPLAGEHQGVKDVAVGGPGFEFPVYEWTGATYEQKRMIPDTEFPQSVN